jgi:exodeoxyribonuclease-3
MRFVSWNINGIKSSFKKGLIDFILEEDADVYCFQETKSHPEDIPDDLKNVNNYHIYWANAQKKGYSGVVCYSKQTPISTKMGIDIEKFDQEGRVLTLEYDSFYLLNVYFVNAGRNLERLEDKVYFNKEFLYYCQELREKKPLIIGGDFNVAHEEKDIANPESNTENAGFTMEEREWFSDFLSKGYIDTFREFESEGRKYTYWTYRYNAREKNIGWRIDYWILSNELKAKLEDSNRQENVKGSDHCPITLTMDL